MLRRSIGFTFLTITGLALCPRVVEAQACGFCADDDGMVTHNAFGWTGGPYGEGHGWHPWEWSGQCIFEHGICVVGSLDLTPTELPDRFAAAVAARDASEVSHLLDTAGSVVRLAPERMAIQVLACDTSVYGHIPLDPGLYDVISATVAEQQQ